MILPRILTALIEALYQGFMIYGSGLMGMHYEIQRTDREQDSKDDKH